MTSYGFYGNVLRESEHMRRLGPVRYDVAGFKSFVQLHSHAAEISYLPARNYNSDEVAGDHTRCRYPCSVCLPAPAGGEEGSEEEEGEATMLPREDSVPKWKVRESCCCCGNVLHRFDSLRAYYMAKK